jgi:hypothetical protein
MSQNVKKHAILLLQRQAFKEDNKMQRRIQGKIERKRNHSKLIAWENDLKDQKEWCIDLLISSQKLPLSQINEKKTRS